MNKDIEPRFQAITEHYQGSCQSMYGHFTGVPNAERYKVPDDGDFIDQNDLQDRLDEIMFECETCGWWSEAGEQSEQEDEKTCQECYEDAQVDS